MPNEPGRIIVPVPYEHADMSRAKKIDALVKERFADGRTKIGAIRVIASGYSDAFPGYKIFFLNVKSGKEGAWIEFFHQGIEGRERIQAFSLKKKRNPSAFIKTIRRLRR